MTSIRQLHLRAEPELNGARECPGFCVARTGSFLPPTPSLPPIPPFPATAEDKGQSVPQSESHPLSCPLPPGGDGDAGKQEQRNCLYWHRHDGSLVLIFTHHALHISKNWADPACELARFEFVRSSHGPSHPSLDPVCFCGQVWGRVGRIE